MAAPFGGEDLIKRSILSSILGLKIKTPKFNQPHNEAPSPSRSSARRVDYDQPCSSKSILQEEQVSIAQPTSQQFHVDQSHHHRNQQPLPQEELLQSYAFEDICQGDQTLSEQLAESLFLASPQSAQSPYPGLSPQDIYHEIVCECEHLEQQRIPNEANSYHSFHDFDNAQHQQAPNLFQPGPIKSGGRATLPTSNFPAQPQAHTNHHQQQQDQEQQLRPQPNNSNICMNCHHAIPSKNFAPSATLPVLQNLESYPPAAYQNQDRKSGVHHLLPGIGLEQLRQATVGAVSLEEFIKLVVVAVKEAGGLGKNGKDVEETPEEILQRKRQQNNEAAARYRKRQREAKQQEEDIIEALVNRNNALRIEIEDTQRQIEMLKSKFALSRP